MKAPTAKPKLISRPKPKATAKPAPAAKPIETPLLGPPVIVAIPAPAPPATEDAAKPANYLVVESEIKPQVVGDAAVPGGYTVIESETADTKKPSYSVVESDSTATVTAEGTDLVVTPPSPSVPTVVIPAGQAMEEISSFQIGDVLIIAVRVQAAPTPEVTP